MTDPAIHFDADPRARQRPQMPGGMGISQHSTREVNSRSREAGHKGVPMLRGDAMVCRSGTETYGLLKHLRLDETLLLLGGNIHTVHITLASKRAGCRLVASMVYGRDGSALGVRIWRCA